MALQQDDGSCFTAITAGKAASQVGSAGAGTNGSGTAGGGCLDRAAPRARIAKAGRSSLRGTTSDRGCGTAGHGSVRAVSVAVAKRVAHGRCRFASGSGRLGKARSCSRRRYLRAAGTTHWSVRFAHRLPRGRYAAWMRARDRAGNARTQAARFAAR